VRGGKGATSTPARAAARSSEPFLFASYNTHAGPDDIVPAGHDRRDVTSGARTNHNSRRSPTRVRCFVRRRASWARRPSPLSGRPVQATYPQPALDATTGFASFRIAATDAEGSKLEQTITRAYPLSVTRPPPAADGPGNAPAPFRPCTTAVIARTSSAWR